MVKILLAEDDTTFQNIIKNFAKKLSLDIDVANDGVEAVKFMESGTTYDLILMDLFMPNLGGKEATMKIRSMNNGSALKIVALSGVDAMEKEEMEKCGFNELVTKPIKKSTFEEIVKKYTS